MKRNLAFILALGINFNFLFSIDVHEVFRHPYPIRNVKLIDYFTSKIQHKNTSYKNLSLAQIHAITKDFQKKAIEYKDKKAWLFAEIIAYSHSLRFRTLQIKEIEQRRNELLLQSDKIAFHLGYCVVNINTALYYAETNDLPRYLHYLSLAYDRYSILSNEEIPIKKYALYQLALSYFKFEDYQTAFRLTQECKKINNDKIDTDVFNNHLMAMCLMHISDLNNAVKLLNYNKLNALKKNRADWYWIERTYQYIISLKINPCNSNIDSLEISYNKLKYLKLTDCQFETGISLLQHIPLHTQSNRLILDDLRLIKPTIKNPKLILDYYLTLRKLFNKSPANERNYVDSILLYHKILNTNQNNNLRARLKSEELAKQFNTQKLILEKEKNKIQLIIISASILVFILIVSAGFYYKKTILIKDHKQLLLKHELLVMKTELEKSKNKLNSFIQDKINQRTIIDDILNDIDGKKDNTINPETLHLLRNSTILTDSDWEKFKTLFNLSYNNFLDEIAIKIPGLTQAEMRYIALKKLRISTRDMAKITGVGENAIRSVKSRLLKKLPDYDKLF